MCWNVAGAFANPKFMTTSHSDVSAPQATPTEPDVAAQKPLRPPRVQSVQPILEKLFELYPHLFGAEFLPLKLGIFQDLLAAHPEQLERAALKAALSVHTRSARYLQSVAAGKKRHDLQGNAVEDVQYSHLTHNQAAPVTGIEVRCSCTHEVRHIAVVLFRADTVLLLSVYEHGANDVCVITSGSVTD